jgi:DNA polymerase I-like protein with 3'-5' exonuclease and polymerase domains
MIPPDGTKQTHRKERDVCKLVALAMNYGMGPAKLAKQIGSTLGFASNLLKLVKERYAAFRQWSDDTVDFARVHRYLETVFGWRINLGRLDPKTGTPWRDTTLRNWRVQAAGGEILRMALIALMKAGFKTLVTVHDSFLIEVPEKWLARKCESCHPDFERCVTRSFGKSASH